MEGVKDLLEGKITSEQAAQFLGVKPKTLNNWIYEGVRLRHLRYGRRLYFDVKDLEAFKRARIEIRN